MAIIIKKIGLSELADMVNSARKEEIGFEFSFGEDVHDDVDITPDDVFGWHTCTKITNTEVCVRYMGGVCFGLITDTDVTEEDMLTYMNSASNFGSYSEDSIVYAECVVPDKIADNYTKLVTILSERGLNKVVTIDYVFDAILLRFRDEDKNNSVADLNTISTMIGIATDLYGENSPKMDSVKVVFAEHESTMVFNN